MSQETPIPPNLEPVTPVTPFENHDSILPPQQPVAAPPIPKSKGHKFGLVVLLLSIVVLLAGSIYYYTLFQTSESRSEQVVLNQQELPQNDSSIPVVTDDVVIEEEVVHEDDPVVEEYISNIVAGEERPIDVFCKTYAEQAGQLCDDDNDGITNMIEASIQTDPLNPDSDNDGYLDGVEYFGFYNPSGSGKLGDSLLGDCADDDKSCLADLAVANQDLQICDRIQDEEYRLQCPGLVEDYKAQMVMSEAVVSFDLTKCDEIILKDAQDIVQEGCRQKIIVNQAIISLDANNCFLPGIDMEDSGQFNSGLMTKEQVTVADCVGAIGKILEDEATCSVFTDTKIFNECKLAYDFY